MKKPIRLFAFVFFLFAIYLNVFYREDSFLARLTSVNRSAEQSETTTPSSSVAVSAGTELAEVKSK